MDAYDALVERDVRTCSAYPTMWEGLMKDGRFFCFRYRYGMAVVAVSKVSLDAAANAVSQLPAGGHWATLPLGKDGDGVIDTEEYRKVFVRLYKMAMA